MQKIWGKGFVVVEELNFNTAAYIARYVQKKAELEPQKREYTGEYKRQLKIDERNELPFWHFIRKTAPQKHIIEPEFIVMSRAVGIGRKYWEENKEKIGKDVSFVSRRVLFGSRKIMTILLFSKALDVSPLEILNKEQSLELSALLKHGDSNRGTNFPFQNSKVK